MATLTHARPLEPDDLEALAPVDAAYAARHGLEPALDPGALRHFVRSGHAFVASRGGEPAGFVLAQAVWDGLRPVVHATRVAVRDEGDAEARGALLAALVKSAYDAAAYDLAVERPLHDEGLAGALAAANFDEAPTRRHERRLGSRGAARPRAAAGAEG